MKPAVCRSFCAVAILTLLALQTALAEPTLPLWQTDLIPSSTMFKSEQDFRDHCAGCGLVVVGKLTSIVGNEWHITVDRALDSKEKPEKVVCLGAGGIHAAKVGDKVLALLIVKDGRWALASRCAASGLFVHSDKLEKLVSEARGK